MRVKEEDTTDLGGYDVSYLVIELCITVSSKRKGRLPNISRLWAGIQRYHTRKEYMYTV